MVMRPFQVIQLLSWHDDDDSSNDVAHGIIHIMRSLFLLFICQRNTTNKTPIWLIPYFRENDFIIMEHVMPSVYCICADWRNGDDSKDRKRKKKEEKRKKKEKKSYKRNARWKKKGKCGKEQKTKRKETWTMVTWCYRWTTLIQFDAMLIHKSNE